MVQLLTVILSVAAVATAAPGIATATTSAIATVAPAIATVAPMNATVAPTNATVIPEKKISNWHHYCGKSYLDPKILNSTDYLPRVVAALKQRKLEPTERALSESLIYCEGDWNNEESPIVCNRLIWQALCEICVQNESDKNDYCLFPSRKKNMAIGHKNITTGRKNITIGHKNMPVRQRNMTKVALGHGKSTVLRG
ncbi:hypothetical protein QQS21_007440 [Conoideocrella luteorostrata]|uniref:Uncharacterized protein n=1 Tax=Conoideocrella luteorostrata TaxID=1105319 RepID=A0AAJ0FSF1_9HYPO|nr:hypothetical protein QQS21_007440 [Conoideocrella luteorostrata]